MAGKPGALSDKPTQLPAQQDRLFPWELDRRCKVVREFAADLVELWQDLGGVENLSAQQRWLSERIVFLRRRMLAYEAAVLDGSEPPMTAGEYSNFANVCQGHLRTLGSQGFDADGISNALRQYNVGVEEVRRVIETPEHEFF